MRVKFNRLDRSYLKYKEQYDNVAIKTLQSGWYTLGKRTKKFEEEFAAFLGVDYCVGVNSGLDALILAFRALRIGKGNEVIVPANTFIASVIGITENGATPIFVEPDEYYNLDADKIEASITERTKAILVVHLYGQGANMEKIKAIAEKHKLYLVEDCAQSHGAKVGGLMTGSWGDIGCFSFYPTKGIGAFGDAGAIVCKNKKLKESLEKLRNYGSTTKYIHEVIGINSRLDELQAGLLSIRLFHYEEALEERRQLASMYLENIDNKKILLPQVREKCNPVWHLFVIQVDDREKFQEHLSSNGIETMVHYPIPPHLSRGYEYLGYGQGEFPISEKLAKHIISLPLYEGMKLEEINFVIEAVNKYKGKL